jgi:cell division initiation protein
MNISFLDIKRKDFKIVLRGYAKEEVDAFLEKLAIDVNALLKENEKLKKDLGTAVEKINEYRKMEKNRQEILIKAQENATRAIESAKKQTSLLVKEAELKAQQVLESARESANEMRNAVIRLREEKNLIVAKLKAIVNSQSQLLDIKIEQAGTEREPLKPIEKPRRVDVDVEEIVNKLL